MYSKKTPPSQSKTCIYLDQKQCNEKRKRRALGLSIALGEDVEFTNGLTVIYKSKKGRRISLVLLIPEEVYAYRSKWKDQDDSEVD